MSKIVAAVAATCLALLGLIGLAGPATATPTTDLGSSCTSQDGAAETCDVWVTWQTPNYAPTDPTLSAVGLPQTLVGLGEVQPTVCGVTYQQDRLVGSREDIDAVLSDGRLTGTVAYPEDQGLFADWRFVSSAPCLERDASAAVTVIAPTCGSAGSVGDVSVVSSAAGPVVAIGGARHEITFTAAAGHLFPAGPGVSDDGTTMVVAFDLLPALPQEKCVTTLADVTFPEATPPTCESGAVLPATPADTDTTTWSWDGDTLTASARTGYAFASGTTMSTTYALADALPSPSDECVVAVASVSTPSTVPTEVPEVLAAPGGLEVTSEVLAAPEADVLAATGADHVQVYGLAAALALLVGSGLLLIVRSRTQHP